MKYITMLEFLYKNQSRQHNQKQKIMTDAPLNTNVSPHGTTY